jgi:hypothetical protein
MDQVKAVMPSGSGASLMFSAESNSRPYVIEVLESFDTVGAKLSFS